MSQRDVIFQCRIVAAELRGTNSDMKIGGGLRRNGAEFSAAGQTSLGEEGVPFLHFEREVAKLWGRKIQKKIFLHDSYEYKTYFCA